MTYSYAVRPTSWVRRAIKKRVYRRDGGVCFWCNRTLTLSDGTLDHITTAGRGGLFRPNNLVLSCFECNNARGDMHPEQFLIRQHGKGQPA